MNALQQGIRPTGGPTAVWRSQVATDLCKLAELHDHALRRETVVALWADCYDGLLGWTPDSAEARAALELICLGLTDIPTYLDAASLASLAAAYADIYENPALGGGPVESAWTLAACRGAPGFGSTVEDWMQRHACTPVAGDARTVDHLASQLQLLAHLLAPEQAAAAGEVARFIDEHLLSWIDRFSDRVRRHSGVRLYQGLAALTAAYLRALHDQLVSPGGIEARSEAVPALPAGQPEQQLAWHQPLGR